MKKEVIILLHGGGLAPWNFHEEAERLKDRYHVDIPVLDGHSGSDRDFTTIEDNADEIISYIDEMYAGNVLMICGLSLGGQILVEILSKRKNICKYAIIESALVLPMRTTYALIRPTFSLCYPLIKKRWFARLQFHSLRMKEQFFDEYYRDSAAITKQNLISFLRANSDYKLKDSVEQCQAKVLIFVGGKESGIMRKSAEILHEKIPNSTLEILPGYYHGDLSINHSELYVEKALDWLRDGLDI